MEGDHKNDNKIHLSKILKPILHENSDAMYDYYINLARPLDSFLFIDIVSIAVKAS